MVNVRAKVRYFPSFLISLKDNQFLNHCIGALEHT